MLVIVALLAAVTVALAGLGFYFLDDSKSAFNASDASVATCSSAARLVPAVIGRKLNYGTRCSTNTRWIMLKWCWVIFPMHASTIMGVKSRFFRKDGKFFVETDGPDGKLAVFERARRKSLWWS
jgi:hypothetical protein